MSAKIERDAAVCASYGRDASGLTRVPEGVVRAREAAEGKRGCAPL